MQQETVEVTTGAPHTDEGMVQCVDEVKDRQSDRNDKENVEESRDTNRQRWQVGLKIRTQLQAA